jgi:hypothetical protein
MWILMLEAGGALLLFVLIVWWTMFSGRDEAGPMETGRDLQGPPARKDDDTPGR